MMGLPIKRIHIEITSECNLGCVYCCFKKEQNNNRIATAEWIRLIEQAKTHDVSSISISGGEPLNAPGIFEVLEKCRELNLKTTLFSNLWGFSERKKLSPFLGKNIKEIITSLDGLDSHGLARPPSNYKEIIEEIFWIKREVPTCKITVNTVITKFNLGELKELFQLLHSIGVDHWRLDLPFRRSNRDIFCNLEEIVDKAREIIVLRNKNRDLQKVEVSLFRIYKSALENANNESIQSLINLESHPCEYFLGTMSVKPNGMISLCPTLGIEFANATSGLSFSKLAEKFSGHSFFQMNLMTIAECRNCKYFLLCATGCRADALYWTGNHKNADPLSCAIMPLVEKEIIPVLSENLKKLYASLIDVNGLSSKYDFSFQKIRERR